jgi:hypothetical protein
VVGKANRRHAVLLGIPEQRGDLPAAALLSQSSASPASSGATSPLSALKSGPTGCTMLSMRGRTAARGSSEVAPRPTAGIARSSWPTGVCQGAACLAGRRGDSFRVVFLDRADESERRGGGLRSGSIRCPLIHGRDVISVSGAPDVPPAPEGGDGLPILLKCERFRCCERISASYSRSSWACCGRRTFWWSFGMCSTICAANLGRVVTIHRTLL